MTGPAHPGPPPACPFAPAWLTGRDRLDAQARLDARHRADLAAWDAGLARWAAHRQVPAPPEMAPGPDDGPDIGPTPVGGYAGSWVGLAVFALIVVLTVLHN